MTEKSTDAGKLKVLMEYWVNHNVEHIKENEKWRERAEKTGLMETAERLRKVIELSEEVNRHIEKARQSLDEESKKELPVSSRDRAASEAAHEHIREEGHRHIALHQIGVIRTPYINDAPRQPDENGEGDFRIIVNEEYTEGLYLLEKFKYIYVLFNLNQRRAGHSLIVSPPGAQGIKVGVFSSRSPFRPNPVGLSIVRVKRVSENVVFISGIDAYDRTPLLDIKPYMEKLDCKPGAGNGWASSL